MGLSRKLDRGIPLHLGSMAKRCREQSHTCVSTHTLQGVNGSSLSVSYLEEVFDFRVVVRLLLDQCGTVQLARAESVQKTKSFYMKTRC